MNPSAVLIDPEVLLCSAAEPVAVFWEPIVFEVTALCPVPVLSPPLVFGRERPRASGRVVAATGLMPSAKPPVNRLRLVNWAC